MMRACRELRHGLLRGIPRIDHFGQITRIGQADRQFQMLGGDDWHTSTGSPPTEEAPQVAVEAGDGSPRFDGNANDGIEPKMKERPNQLDSNMDQARGGSHEGSGPRAHQ